MGVVNYCCIDGEILSGSQAGNYLRDALGSVMATSSPATGAVQNTYRYKPYGSQLASTGTSPTPKFQWVGTAGYRQTSISHSSSYVRARHYGQEEGRWTTVDPIWFWQPQYAYVKGSPAHHIDKTGLFPTFIGCGGTPQSEPRQTLANCYKGLSGLGNKQNRDDIKKCMATRGWMLPPLDVPGTDRELDFIYKLACCTCVILNGKDKCGSECKRVRP